MAASTNGSPFPPVSQMPLHKNPALAPSQELAYRSKCIELRRRLKEIERSNDETRKRIMRERKAQDKLRLNRAILLNHLKEMVGNGKRLTQDQLRALGNGKMADALGYPGGDVAAAYADEGSEGTEEEDIAEPQERPLRSKRANHRGDITMNVSPSLHNSNVNQPTPTPQAQPSSQPSHLPALAPASSPIQHHTSAGQAQWHATPTPGQSGSPPNDDVAPPHSAPIVSQFSTDPPSRPVAPFDKFSEYHTQALSEQGSISQENIPSTIRRMWNEAAEADKRAEEENYEVEMEQYERDMEVWKREQEDRK